MLEKEIEEEIEAHHMIDTIVEIEEEEVEVETDIVEDIDIIDHQVEIDTVETEEEIIEVHLDQKHQKNIEGIVQEIETIVQKIEEEITLEIEEEIIQEIEEEITLEMQIEEIQEEIHQKKHLFENIQILDLHNLLKQRIKLINQKFQQEIIQPLDLDQEVNKQLLFNTYFFIVLNNKLFNLIIFSLTSFNVNFLLK